MNARSQGQKGIRHAMSHGRSVESFCYDNLDRIMSFSYGPDMERWYSAMTTDGQKERTTVYA